MRAIFYNTNDQLRPGFLLIIAFLAIMAASFAAELAIIPIMLIQSDAPTYIHLGPVSMSAAVIIVYSLFYGLITWWLCKLIFKKFYRQEELGMIDCYSFKLRTWKLLGGGMLLGIVAFGAVALPLYLSGDYVIEFVGIDIIPVLLYLWFYTAVGIVEEVATRGVMQHALMRYNKWLALVAVSIFFAAMHLLNPNVSVASMIGLFLAGIFIGMSMYATGSLTVAIGVHITWNWLQGTILGIPVSGTEASGYVFSTTIVGTNDWITGGEFGAEASVSCFIALIVLSFALYYYMKKKEKCASST